jgi:hypothetical protein
MKQSPADPRQIGFDVAIAVGLLIALSIVYVVDRRSPRDTAANPDAPKLEITEQNGVEMTETTKEKPLSIAVTRSEEVYDDVGKLLRDLGQGYRYTDIDLADIRDYEKIAQFDLIFLTCGTHPKSWLGEPIGSGDRPGVRTYTWNDSVIRQLRVSLEKFLDKGGTLYASDWQFAILQACFPRDIDSSRYVLGEGNQHVEAEVVEESLRELIGQSLQLKFDLDGWKPAAFKADQMKVYLEGDYRAKDGRMVRAPLLVKYPRGKGQIIFTSFHNEKQNSAAEMKLLKFLVFAAVTARIETRVSTTLVNGGFSPSKQSLLSVDKTQSVSQVYKNKNAGKLLFVLGFAQEGAELELKVTAPDGAEVSKKGTTTLQIEVPDSIAGDYQYTITAHKVPYPNFPFTLTIGNK